ncbi:MAG: FG-GAP-like repeat-containing protein, partial [Chloroflexi bacterium]|nr:FG-GAP-like repeat-containing protein [Chloroflexota bacterium]
MRNHSHTRPRSFRPRWPALLLSLVIGFILILSALGLLSLPAEARDSRAEGQSDVLGGPAASFDAALREPAASQVITDMIALDPEAFWTAGDDVETNSVAWGDMDGDGDLDLAAALGTLGVRVYLNLGDILQTITDAPLTLANGEVATDLAWGDVDGDGDLDLAVANRIGSELVYLNVGGTLANTPGWSSESNDESTSVAWGDVDGDGDLDLAVGNWNQMNKLYLNEGGTLQATADQSFGDGNTQSLAWGDVDNDGDLDLATGNTIDFSTGNTCAANKVYLNVGGDLTTVPPWSSGDTDCTYSVAWGDVDGDGDLDLAAGNIFGPNRLYLNSGNALQTPAAWSSNDNDYTLSVAWGDADGDGDLDLAAGNDQTLDPGCNCFIGGQEKVYRNVAGMLQADAGWTANSDDTTESVAWGDVDGDGDLDLAAGNNSISNKLYLNTGKLLEEEADKPWNSGAIRNTSSLAWGDVDGDGDLDLAVGNENQPSEIYRNDGLDVEGKLKLALFWSTPTSDTTKSVAWGDIDSDGDLDLAVGNFEQLNKVYQNNGLDGSGNLQMALLWDAASADFTNSVAWGDVDGDGDLDLAVGNGQDGEPNRVYLNSGGTLDEVAAWNSTENDRTMSVAWGDVDGDGDLDLAVGNFGDGGARLYLNQGGALDSEAAWSALIDDFNFSVAWGDVDGDGDLDLATGAWLQHPGRVFLNQGGTLQTIHDFPPTFGHGDSILGIAWGDVDGDGHLDLVSGNELEPSVVFLNDQGELGTSAEWRSVNDDQTTAVAWGDVDGDGRLDLAIGSYDGPIWVYRNQLTPDLLFPNQPPTNLVFDLDHSPANYYAMPEIHDGTIPFTYTLYHPAGEPAWSVQGFYSLDGGDNWLPAVATSDTPTINLAINTPIAYQNAFSGTALSFDGVDDYVAVPDSNSLDLAPQLTLEAWVRVEAFDKPWQAIVTKGDMAYRLHRFGNSNTVAFGTNIGPSAHDLLATSNVADGQWHHLAATYDGAWKRIFVDGVEENAAPMFGPVNVTTAPLAIGENLQAPGRFFNGVIDDVRLWNIARTPAQIQTDMNRSFYGNWPGLVASWPMDEGIGGTIFDQTSSNNDGSLGGGMPAAQPAWVRNQTTFAGTYVYTWDVFGSGFFGRSDNVVFRLQASNGSLVSTASMTGTFGYTNTIPGPFQRPFVSGQTFPFRVRGSQVRVFSETITATNAVSNAIVYRLPSGQDDGASPLVDLAGIPYRTDSQGYLQGRGQLTIGDSAATADTLYALLPITATDSYTLYYTSATPTSTGLQGEVITQTGVVTLAVSAANPLILFNLDISLEWDARNDAAYLEQLEADVQRASEILYDLSNGQAALGEVRIFQAKENWTDSDIIIYAANNVRPSASMGGVVITSTAEVLSNSTVITEAYLPGQVRLGPTWGRFGDPDNDLGEDWPRALAHELGHYLLFLPDNYLGLDGERLVTTDCTGSVMTDAYSDEYSEFLTAAGWLGDCLQTVAQQTTGRPDWETIITFYGALLAPASPTNAGPSSLPLAVTGINFEEPADEATALAAPFFSLRDTSGEAIFVADGQGQGYLFKNWDTAALTDDYVLALGAPVGDQMNARGAEPGDRLCIYDFSQATTRLGCTTVGTVEGSVTLYPLDGWEPAVQLSPQVVTTTVGPFTTTLGLVVTVSQEITTGNLYAQVLPATGFSTTFPITATISQLSPLSPTNPLTFSQLITLPYPALEGYVRLWLGTDPTTPLSLDQEAMTSFYLGDGWGGNRQGWGGNRQGWGGNRQGWGGNRQGWGAPVASGDGQVIIFNVSNIFSDTGVTSLQALSFLPGLPAWLTPVGQGYRFKASAAYTRSIAFGYLQTDVPGGDLYEYVLQIYYSPDEGQSWQPLPTELDTLDNLAAATMPAANQGGGLYVLASTIELPSLLEGWNQIVYPLPGVISVTEALASIEGKYTSLYFQDPETSEWQLHDATVIDDQPELAGLVNDLANLAFGRSYWLYATEAVSFYLGLADGLDGRAPGFLPELPPATYYGWITPTAGFTPTAGMSVTATISGTLCGQGLVQSWSGGLAYRVHVRAEGPAAPGCGADGRPVVFAVGGVTMAEEAAWDNSQAQYHPLSQLAAATDLAVSQVALPNAPQAEQNLAYLITVTNRGPLSATGVILSDTLPAGAQFLLGVEAQGQCAETAGVVTCNLGTLAAYSSREIVVGIVVPAASPVITNSVT